MLIVSNYSELNGSVKKNALRVCALLGSAEPGVSNYSELNGSVKQIMMLTRHFITCNCFQLFRTQWLGKGALTAAVVLTAFVSNYSELSGSVKLCSERQHTQLSTESFQLFRTQWLGKAPKLKYSTSIIPIGFQLFRTQWLGKV